MPWLIFVLSRFMEPLWLEMHCCMPSTPPSTQTQKKRPTHIPMKTVCTVHTTYSFYIQYIQYIHRINVNKISLNEKISSILGNIHREYHRRWFCRCVCLLFVSSPSSDHTILIVVVVVALASYENSLKSYALLQCQCILLLCYFHYFRHFTYCITLYECV